MAYTDLQPLADGEFKRLCGVSRNTFAEMVEFETGQIICTAVDSGKTHDFKLLKRSRLPFVSSPLCLADRGYQGLALASCWGLHPN